MADPTSELERRIEKLRPGHPIEGFDCGRHELNQYLLRYAWTNQQAAPPKPILGSQEMRLLVTTRWPWVMLAARRRPSASPKDLRGILCQLCCLRGWQWTGGGKAKASAKRFCGTRCCERCKPPTSPAFVLSQFTQKMQRPSTSTKNSTSFHRLPILCISLSCSKMCGE